MTISAVKEKPFSMLFLFFNFLIFWTLKFLVFDKVTHNQPAILTYVIIIVSALVTSFLYILISIQFTRKTEKKVISNSNYVREYGCSLFRRYKSPFIVRFRKGECDFYMNETYLVLTQYPSDRMRYISDLRSKLFMLNARDILCIYCYKYMYILLTSVFFFTVWHVCVVCNINIYIIILICLIVVVYFIIDKICTNLVNKSMRKRKLEIFMNE
jgi:hypothetical protein